MKRKVSKLFLSTIVFILAVLYLVKFGGPAILKTYIQLGIGSCQKIPILCRVPEKELTPQTDKDYLAQLLPYNFPGIEIRLPKGFVVIKGEINKVYPVRKPRHARKILSNGVYYKRHHQPRQDATVYLLSKNPEFFIGLFPQVKIYGINDDYTFLSRAMHAKIDNIKNLTDTFFVIMKSVFTPDLGDQRNVRIAEFRIEDKRGFVSYTEGASENYFDCNILDTQGNFFKVYIKDKGAQLDLDKVFSIISSVNKP